MPIPKATPNSGISSNEGTPRNPTPNISVSRNPILNIKDFNDWASSDYFRSYLFQVWIVVPNLLELGLSFDSIFISATSTPYMTTTVQNIDYMHTQIRQAGRTQPQQWQVTVRDDCNKRAFSFFNTWKSLVYSYSNNGTLPKTYKGSATLILNSPDNEQQRYYSIFGLWPMEIGATTLDYEQESIITFPVTLSFDYFKT